MYDLIGVEVFQSKAELAEILPGLFRAERRLDVLAGITELDLHEDAAG